MQDEYDFILVRGKPRYRKNKRMVAKNTLPRDVMERFGLLNSDTPKEDEDSEKGYVNLKGCIFCGEHSRLTRFVNLQTVYLCDTHYYDMTIGKIAQRLNEVKEKQHA